MTSVNINKNCELNKFIYLRIPPFIWNIIGYIGGLITVFYFNKNGIIAFSCLFTMYGILNILFDIFTVSIEYSNDNLPNYINIGFYNFIITNKKYVLQSINNAPAFETSNFIDNNKLKIELSIYDGDYIFIKYFLLGVYLLGITNKNYTIISVKNLKTQTIQFV